MAVESSPAISRLSEKTEDILSDSVNADLRCDCPHCRGSRRDLSSGSKAHFLYHRTHEVDEIDALGSTDARIQWFHRRVTEANQRCDEIRRRGRADLNATLEL